MPRLFLVPIVVAWVLTLCIATAVASPASDYALSGPGIVTRGSAITSSSPDASAARPRTRITATRMKLRGFMDSDTGAYEVEVAVRLRVCGRAGLVAYHITETSSPPGRNDPVFARSRNTVEQDQLYRCDTHRITWILQDKFFGISRYRVGVRARTTGRDWSQAVARHVDTYD